MRSYLLVMAIAAGVTFVATSFARWLALRTGAMTQVRERDVHLVPTPRMGGVGIYIGLTTALIVGVQLPFLRSASTDFHGIWALVASAGMVCLLGAADDLWDLDWLTKLAGQVLAAGLLAWQGVQLVTVPIFGLTIGSSRLLLAVSVLVVVVSINAVNFVDGLDGLAAGVVAIGASAFFLYCYQLTKMTDHASYGSYATFVLAALVGACLGFLPHNFSPARIFMGDSGSMVLGLVFAAGTITATRIDPGMVAVNSRQAFPTWVPLLLPVAVLALPLLDMCWAVVRRVKAGESPFHADRMHLHHRLLNLGHTHRRAVAIMYVWTALFSFAAAALIRFTAGEVLVGLGIGVVIALFLTLGPLRNYGRPVEPEPDGALPPSTAARPSPEGSPRTVAPPAEFKAQAAQAPTVPTPPPAAGPRPPSAFLPPTVRPARTPTRAERRAARHAADRSTS